MLKAEVYTRKIKAIAGNASTKIKITPTPGKRLFSVQCELTYAGGTNTLAALMTALTEIRVKVGTVVKWRCNGTKLRDFCLLHGLTYDFNGLPNTGAQVTIPLAPEWFLPDIQDMLAWNPARLGGDITIEIDSTATLTVTEAFETVNDDLSAQSLGILTLEVINPVAAGTAFYVEKEIDPVGQLYLASFYPDSGGSQEVTPVSMYVGSNDAFAFERLTSAQNDERLERFGKTPAATGRTANVFDMLFAKDSGLGRSIDLAAWGVAKFRPEAAVAMTGTMDILLVRIQ